MHLVCCKGEIYGVLNCVHGDYWKELLMQSVLNYDFDSLVELTMMTHLISWVHWESFFLVHLVGDSERVNRVMQAVPCICRDKVLLLKKTNIKQVITDDAKQLNTLYYTDWTFLFCPSLFMVCVSKYLWVCDCFQQNRNQYYTCLYCWRNSALGSLIFGNSQNTIQKLEKKRNYSIWQNNITFEWMEITSDLEQN